MSLSDRHFCDTEKAVKVPVVRRSPQFVAQCWVDCGITGIPLSDDRRGCRRAGRDATAAGTDAAAVALALVRFVPVGARAYIYAQRDTQFASTSHAVANGVGGALDRVRANLEHQFVVYLHD
jgi:hypothetical protein